MCVRARLCRGYVRAWYTATIAFCYWECSRPAYKPGRTDSEARRKANTPSLNRFKTFWFAVYLAAWALLIFLLLLEDVVKVDEAAFNPFEILGVEVRRSLSPLSHRRYAAPLSRFFGFVSSLAETVMTTHLSSTSLTPDALSATSTP